MVLNRGVILQLIWNTLPDQFRAADKIGTFKNLMSMFDFSNFTF